jgi:hypothetical protein
MLSPSPMLNPETATIRYATPSPPAFPEDGVDVAGRAEATGSRTGRPVQRKNLVDWRPRMADEGKPDRSGKLFQGISALSALGGVLIALLGAGVGGVVVREAAPKTVTETVNAGGDGGGGGGGGSVDDRRTTPTTACKPTESSHGTDYEPNDDKVHPFGPLAENETYGNGMIDTSNDEDWFVFCTTAHQQLKVDFTVENDTNEGCGEGATLVDTDGNEVGDGPTAPYVNETGHITYTAPSAGRYFVQVSDGNPGCRYALRVNSDHPFAATVQ